MGHPDSLEGAEVEVVAEVDVGAELVFSLLLPLDAASDFEGRGGGDGCSGEKTENANLFEMYEGDIFDLRRAEMNSKLPRRLYL